MGREHGACHRRDRRSHQPETRRVLSYALCEPAVEAVVGDDENAPAACRRAGGGAYRRQQLHRPIGSSVPNADAGRIAPVSTMGFAVRAVRWQKPGRLLKRVGSMGDYGAVYVVVRQNR